MKLKHSAVLIPTNENQPMKTYIINLFLLTALIAGLGLILAGRVTAQTFTNLYSFTAISTPSSTNSDGANPYAGLILSGNTLYGTAVLGGSSGQGTVFKVNTDGTSFTNLHSFSFNGYPYYTNSDGVNPYGGLILSGNTLYGTANQGGTNGSGTVFAVSTNGTGFTTLHSFTATPSLSPYTNSDGAYPRAGLILSGTILYGTTFAGGSSGDGTVFKVNTDGTGFTTLYIFRAGSNNPSGYYTNSDGAGLYAGLILSGNALYGTAAGGGSSGKGTVFAVNTDGTGFTNLHSFTATSSSLSHSTNSDGVEPLAGLILSCTTPYGTANGGGSSGNGTVFAVNTDGTGFTNLHSFTATSGSYRNSDGANPSAGLILSDTTLYGTAYLGGSSGPGTVFAVNTDGTGFTNLYSFTAVSGPYPSTNSDGAGLYAGLILSGTTLYGTAAGGGSSGQGTVFSLTLNNHWTPLANRAPGNVQLMLLLSDGTVMCFDGKTTNWFKLTPNSSGSYINGTWSNLASMTNSRRFMASQVLQNGKVMVAGAEYGTGGATTELYDPVANNWTPVTVPAGLLDNCAPDSGNGFFRDPCSMLLSNGTMM